MGAQHLPGEEVWVIGEHRSTGERKYYLSNLPADTPLKQLAAAIKARWAAWICIPSFVPFRRARNDQRRRLRKV
jgi:SRSO17 transposase